MAPSPGGTLLGASQLQTAIDNLTTQVRNLTTAMNGLRQSGVASGAGSSNWRANPAGGGSGVSNTPLFPRPQAPPATPYSAAQPGQTPYGYNPKHAASYTTPTGGSNPSYGTARPMLNQIAGFGPGQGKITGGAATTFGAMTAVASSISSFGKAQFSNQIGMNAYAQQASLSAPTNMTFGQINAQLYNQAFGGNGNTPWAIANNAMDAAQGQLVLNSAAGTYNPSSTGQGRNISQAAGAFGYINPTLGLTGSAQMSAQLYNPQTSMMMRSLGYPVTPRVLGRPGQTNSAGAVVQGMMQRMYGGRKSISQNQLAANLAPGQTGFIDLQQVFGNQAGAWSTTMEAYNRAAQKGMGQQQFSTLLNQAVQNKGGAQQTLAKRGILDTSDLQSIKDLGSQKTARASDYSSSYNAALQTSTGLLTQFNAELSKILKSTGADTVLGGAGGASAVMHNLTGFGSMGLGIGGGLTLAKTLFGGKAAGTVLGKGGSTVASAGSKLGGALDIGGGAAAAAGGAAASGVGIGAILRALSDSLARKGTTAGGISNALQSTGNPIASVFGGLGGRLANMVSGIGGGAAQPQTSQSASNASKKQVGGGPSASAVEAVRAAERYLGTPYVYGGDNPSTGFDCSGLVMYAYDQAGVRLPRTSEEQWAFLRKKAVSLKSVREGDLVFASGVGDGGSPDNPGHVGMMISSNQLIQAPHTGADVDIIKYDPSAWSHAARPTGSLAGGATVGGVGAGAAGQLLSTGSSSVGGVGNAGAAFNSSEASTISTGNEASSLGGGGVGGGPGVGSGKVLGTAATILGGAKGGGTSAGAGSGATSKNLTGNKRIMNQAAAKYGWGTGSQWSALYALEMSEAGFNNLAQNPSSTAFGMGQFLDSTWSGYGPKTSNPTLQAKYMMEYIKNKYQNPVNADRHENQFHWYAKGTANAYRGVSVVGENGPELIQMRGGENIANASQTSSIMNRSQLPTITINVAKGAIAVNGGGGNTTDAGKSGREIAKEFLSHLSSENIYAAIGVGQKL